MEVGAPLGMPAQAPTIATALKSMGYATGQFGKNHLGDLNQFLPCVHGFDEFFGYLYHLDAMEDPDHRNYPQALKDKVGPRNRVSCQASDKAGKSLGGTTYKVHLDGYDQTDLLTGKGPSKRHEVFYFAETTLGAVRMDDYKYRFIDQPGGWLGGTVKVDWPIIVNLRLDPFERTGLPKPDGGSLAFYNWFAYEFWRFVLVKQEIAQYAQTFLDFPPMQKGASFNLEALKAELEKKMEALKGNAAQ